MKKLFVILFLAAVVVASSFAQQKFALVIGNGAYSGTGMTKLTNPVNDANDVADALRGLGFTVDKVLDGNLEQMENAISRLKKQLSVSKNCYGFFFYAGHGVQSGGANYLIPVGANIPSENYLRERAISIQAMLGELNDAGNDLNVVVLDACRDNPFGWGRTGGSRGLVVDSNPPADSIIVYATSAGSIAADGIGRNGLFTSKLLKNLETPGLEVSEVFRLTGDDVQKASGRKQIPAIYNQFFGRAYLGTPPVASTPPQPAPAPAPQPAPTPVPTPTSAVQPAAPPQRPASDNMVRINGGTFTMGSPANEPGRGNNETQHQVTVSSFYMGKYPVTQKEYQEVMGTNPSNFKGDNLPVEKVSWRDAVVFCNKRSMKEGLTPAYRINNSTDPARWGTVNSNATWDAVQIVPNSTGYRLPTEAQWEYACRAGTTTPFSTGNNITTSQANYDGGYPYNNNAKGENRGQTTPIGSFAPNAWGLYDMHGNVYEWCWDRDGDYSVGTQTDPTGSVSGHRRVIRGGSWLSDGQHARSAYRSNYFPNNRLNKLGFRLVRPSGTPSAAPPVANAPVQPAPDTFGYFFPSDNFTKTFSSVAEASEYINAATNMFFRKIGNKQKAKWYIAKLQGTARGDAPVTIVCEISAQGGDRTKMNLSGITDENRFTEILRQAHIARLYLYIFHNGRAIACVNDYLIKGYQYTKYSRPQSFWISGNSYTAEYPSFFTLNKGFQYLRGERN